MRSFVRFVSDSTSTRDRRLKVVLIHDAQGRPALGNGQQPGTVKAVEGWISTMVRAHTHFCLPTHLLACYIASQIALHRSKAHSTAQYTGTGRSTAQMPTRSQQIPAQRSTVHSATAAPHSGAQLS